MGLLFSFLALLGTAFTHNITDKPFFYYDKYPIHPKFPKSEIYIWRKDVGGYIGYEKECLNDLGNKYKIAQLEWLVGLAADHDLENPHIKHDDKTIYYKECETARIPSTLKHITVWRSSFLDYMINLTPHHKAKYYYVTVSFIISLIFYLGFLEKLYRWIKHGNSD